MTGQRCRVPERPGSPTRSQHPGEGDGAARLEVVGLQRLRHGELRQDRPRDQRMFRQHLQEQRCEVSQLDINPTEIPCTMHQGSICLDGATHSANIGQAEGCGFSGATQRCLQDLLGASSESHARARTPAWKISPSSLLMSKTAQICCLLCECCVVGSVVNGFA